MINVEHIEELMFDYFEGNLSPDKMKELEKFVQDNPSYQVDFDAWKDSYFVQDDKKVPFAYTSLLAGTGAAWLKWAGLGLILLFVGYGTHAYLNSDQTEQDDKQQTELAENAGTNSNMDSEVQGPKGSGEISFSDTDGNGSGHGEIQDDSGETKKGRGEDFGFGQTETSGGNDDQGTMQSGTQKSERGHDSRRGSNDKTQKQNRSVTGTAGRKPGKKDRSITAQAFSNPNGKSDDPKGKTKRFAFSKTKNNQGDHKNLALAQAVNFFDDGGRGGANQFSYDGSFPSLTLSNRNSKKTGRESGLARLIRNISNGILPVQELGLRNFRDPYFVIPEFKSAIAQNGGYAGSFSGLRAKLSYRMMGDVHQANASFDGRFGKNFRIGTGGMINQLFYEDANIKSSKTDITVMVSPKIEISRDATFSPNISLTAGRQSHMIKNGNFQQVELERGYVFGVSNRLESDTMNIGTVSHDYFDFSAGGLLQAKSFHLGFQLNNILASSMNTDYVNLGGAASTPLDLRVVLGTDYKYSDFSSTTFSPSIVFNQRGNYTDVWAGAYMKIGSFLIGANYGNHGEGAAMIGIQTPRMRFSLSGDYTKRYLLNEKAFSFGTSLRLFLGKKSKSTDLPQT